SLCPSAAVTVEGNMNKSNQHIETDAPKTSGQTNETADQWWARISPMQKRVVRQIAVMMEQLTESKRIEIRRDEAIRARFIHILKQPQEGCLSAILLPEIAREGWN